MEFTYALRFRFDATNNEAEYEALIAGLRIAEEMGVKNLQANVDSRLVANQVNGTYVAKEADMIRYLEKVKALTGSFKAFTIKQIPRSENKKADALSKIASTSFSHLSKQVLVEELKEKSNSEVEVLAVVEEEGDTWMTPIFKYLTEETLPTNMKKARAIRCKSWRFVIINGILYKKSFLGPWLRCVGPLQANYVLREIHEGSCSMHAGTRSVVVKALQTGYYWPTMHKDARTLIRACQDCQIHKPVPRNPQQKLTPITSLWPFYKFGLLGEIISDNGKQFLKKWDPNVNLLKEDVVNVSVLVKLHCVRVTAFSKDALSAIATKLGTPLMLDYYTYDICMQSWGRSRYARSMIELQADVELKDTIMVDMPKIVRKRFYTCTIRVEYEWKPPRCACYKVFGHIQDECSKNLGSDVAKKSKIPSQAPRGVLVGPKVGFKLVKQLYRLVSKKNNVNTNGNKKNDVESTKKVSNPNPFDMLNSVENDVDLVTLVDDEGKPLKNVDSSGDHDSEDEVASVDNEMASFLTSKKVGYGTNSLLEQWKETYENADYDYDTYDDDMYEGQEIPDKIQSICDNLDIKVRGRKEK
ncbi:reverse transcriptase domain-containing protein [Tanacetum coccineum]